MNRGSQIVPLKCSNCGGALDVTPAMDFFACGYCGSQLVVLRNEGTVTLEVAIEAVARIQRGTDRTAAELAVRRLREDLVEIETERQRLAAEIKKQLLQLQDTKPETSSGCGSGLALIVGMCVTSVSVAHEQFAIGLFALACAVIVPLILIVANNRQKPRRLSAIERELNDYARRARGELDERASRIRNELNKYLSILNDTIA